MISFKFNQDARKNFTPSNKIIEYAKQNGFNFYRTHFGTLVVDIKDHSYRYNSYTIHPNENNTETVEIFLELF